MLIGKIPSRGRQSFSVREVSKYSSDVQTCVYEIATRESSKPLLSSLLDLFSHQNDKDYDSAINPYRLQTIYKLKLKILHLFCCCCCCCCWVFLRADSYRKMCSFGKKRFIPETYRKYTSRRRVFPFLSVYYAICYLLEVERRPLHLCAFELGAVNVFQHTILVLPFSYMPPNCQFAKVHLCNGS